MFHLSHTEGDQTNKIIKDITCNSECPSLYLSFMLCFQRSYFKRAPFHSVAEPLKQIILCYLCNVLITKKTNLILLGKSSLFSSQMTTLIYWCRTPLMHSHTAKKNHPKTGEKPLNYKTKKKLTILNHKDFGSGLALYRFFMQF